MHYKKQAVNTDLFTLKVAEGLPKHMEYSRRYGYFRQHWSHAWAVGPPKLNGITGPDPLASFTGP